MTQITIQSLLNTLPQVGSIAWIGLRPTKRAPINIVDHVETCTKEGLIGDRYSGKNGKRHVTLIQQEHLSVIASVLNQDICHPEALRRNIVVTGINLLALKGKKFKIGDTTLEYTGLCHPCSLMEKVLGPGGYNAMRGHGGITARIIENGSININDEIYIFD